MDEYIFSKNTIEFVTVGVEFCAFMEKVSETEKKDFIDTSIKILPLLYLKATLLPDKKENDEYDTDIEHFVNEEIYEYIRNSIERLLGEQDSYLEVFQADMQYSETPIISSISENMSDIYQDIKDFVSIYSLGNEECMRTALNECKDNFINYWGQRLVNVLRALHTLRYSQEEIDDENIHEWHKAKSTEKNNLFTRRQESWKEDVNMDEWDKWNE
ncbi:DUF5063 domain-containing protein [Coprobacter sp.]